MNKAGLWGFALLLASNVSAAPLTPAQIDAASREADRIQREQLERIEQERREELLKRPRTVIEIEEPSVPTSEEKGPCRDIREILIEGAALMSDADRDKIVTPYVGRCMTVRDIESLLGEITKFYIDKGFISARAYIQTQDLNSGILRVLVIEGIVEKLMLDDNTGDENINLVTAFPTVKGGPLNLRDIEQGLDQINRLSSNNATMDIKPGEKAGGSVVVIRNRPARRLHANLTLDNLGSTSTGEEMAGLNVSLDNPLRHNDSLNVTHRRSTRSAFSNTHSRSNSFLYSVPVGYYTLTGSHTWSDYATTIRPPGGALISNGYSMNSSLAVEYVAYRDQINRLGITGNLTRKRSDNYLAGQLLGVSSRVLSTFDLGAAWNTRMLDGVFGLNLGHTWGIRWFNALRDPNWLPPNVPHAQFRKWTMSANWTKPFQIGAQNFTFSTAGNTQYGVDVLYGSEQFSIGGLYSVRGYRNTSIGGDSGYYWRNDLAMPVQARIADAQLTIKPYVAYDLGRIRDRYTEFGGYLSGMAMGINFYGPGFSAEISAMAPLAMPSQLQNEGTQYFAKLNFNF